VDPLTWLGSEIEDLRQHQLLRTIAEFDGPPEPEVIFQGRRYVLLASNNYLGLASDARVLNAAVDALRRYGASTSASRLISGSTALHRELEGELAAWKGTEAAILFSSGYLANLGTICALVGPGDVVYCDRLNHASIIDAAFLSRARLIPYRHCDAEHLAELLERHPGRRRLIVSDSIFSMDGDLAPLPDLADLADRWGAMLMVDEAHASGVIGPRGAGAVAHFGLRGSVPIVMGTLSKALGSVGGFVAGSSSISVIAPEPSCSTLHPLPVRLVPPLPRFAWPAPTTSVVSACFASPRCSRMSSPPRGMICSRRTLRSFP
jgi:7-keto-8-aminopelargonate synthetase-like enzyme